MHDVIVIGAGPGGSATAYYLARRGLDVLLLDKASFPRDKTCGDGLTPRALSVLANMGILGQLEQVGCRINGLDICAPNSRSISAAIPASTGRPSHMLVLPRFRLDESLRQHALGAGAQFEGRVHVTGVEQAGNGVVVRAENGSSRSATFAGRAAVIATGASPKLLQRTGLMGEVPPMMVAARAYYDDLAGLTDHVQLRFDGVPLPGYAWVFPTSATSANVGAGYFSRDRSHARKLASPQDAFDSFVRTSRLSDALAQARRVSPVKGYPLRVDFTRARTFGDRVLLVGEAAGLVNPLSGEGVDYALESGRVAAAHLAGMFERGDFARERFLAYDRELRDHFQSLFLFCERVRRVFFNGVALDLLVGMAARRDDLKTLLIRIVLGDQAVPRRLSYGKMLKLLFARD